MAKKKKNQTKKVRFKLRFYIFCALFFILLVYLVTAGIGKILKKDNAKKPTNDVSSQISTAADPSKVEPKTPLADSAIPDKAAKKEAKKEDTSKKTNEKKNATPAPNTSLTEIVVNFKDKDGNPIDMNITPNCFLTSVSQELQWKKAIYQNLLEISSSGKENLYDTPTLSSYTGKSITIKMSTATEQYFRFIFIPKESFPNYNPKLHGELNIHFTTTPADNGVRVVYDAVLDYSAAMIDDVLTLNLVEEGFMKQPK